MGTEWNAQEAEMWRKTKRRWGEETEQKSRWKRGTKWKAMGDPRGGWESSGREKGQDEEKWT